MLEMQVICERARDCLESFRVF